MTDSTMAGIFGAIERLQSGDRDGARAQLAAIWARIESAPEPIHECTLAHYMADTQDAIADELSWDLRALNAALRCTDADAQQHSQAFSIGAFMPSLHLNLADDYFRLGDIEPARMHLASARSFADRLSDDPYGQMIRGGIERLAKKLEANG